MGAGGLGGDPCLQTNNLYLTPYSSLMSGTSLHGPVVRPRRSGRSILSLIVGPDWATAFEGARRMPDGSPQIPDADRQKIADWIDQGARNN